MNHSTHIDDLALGSSYEEICQILGEPTTLVSEEIAQMEPGITINSVNSALFEWVQDNGNCIRLLFRQGKLSDKAMIPAES